MGDDQSLDSGDLVVSVSMGIAVLDRREPEDREGVAGRDVNMRRLTTPAILVGPEEELEAGAPRLTPVPS